MKVVVVRLVFPLTLCRVRSRGVKLLFEVWDSRGWRLLSCVVGRLVVCRRCLRLRKVDVVLTLVVTWVVLARLFVKFGRDCKVEVVTLRSVCRSRPNVGRLWVGLVLFEFVQSRNSPCSPPWVTLVKG